MSCFHYILWPISATQRGLMRHLQLGHPTLAAMKRKKDSLNKNQFSINEDEDQGEETHY